MINLEEYKNVLINKYRYEIDNTENKKQQRKELLARQYSDEYLNKIINNTYKVIKTILDSNDYLYYNIDMEEDTTTYISLNLTGGWFSDRLFIDAYGNIISEYILKRTFGNYLIVCLKIEEHDFAPEDPDIMSFDHSYSLYLQGFPKNMKEIKEEIFGVSKVKKLNSKGSDY